MRAVQGVYHWTVTLVLEASVFTQVLNGMIPHEINRTKRRVLFEVLVLDGTASTRKDHPNNNKNRIVALILVHEEVLLLGSVLFLLHLIYN